MRSSFFICTARGREAVAVQPARAQRMRRDAFFFICYNKRTGGFNDVRNGIKSTIKR